MNDTSMVGKTCPFCQSTIKPGVAVTVCSACGIPHHSDCWRENGGCTTFGCQGAPSAFPTGIQQPLGTANECPICGYLMRPLERTCPRCEALRRHGVVTAAYRAERSAQATHDTTVPGYQTTYLTNQDVPAGVSGWNWGAFAITPIWCAAMNRWGWCLVAILANLVCGLLGIVISIYLGIEGNKLAWQSRRWRDVQHFRDTQAIWNSWGKVLFGISIGILIIYLIIIICFMVGIANSLSGY